MSWIKFWKTIPKLVAPFLRAHDQVKHPIPLRIEPSTATPGAYSDGNAGRRARTALELQLDRVQSLLVADHDATVAASAKLVRQLNDEKNRQDSVPSLTETLKPVILGPSSVETLLRNGRAKARQRDRQQDPAYRGYRPAAKAGKLAAIDDMAGLEALINEQARAISLVGQARNAAQAIPTGFRKTKVQINKGRRPRDETISHDLFGGIRNLSIMEMAELSFASGVNASRIWVYFHGEPDKIDYHRVFELAVFAGRLSRGEPATISWDLVRYYLAHCETPNIQHPIRARAYPNTAPVHDAIEWILARIDEAYGIHAFTGELIGCDQPGECKTFRRAPLPA
jgi:hypothetical protein